MSTKPYISLFPLLILLLLIPNSYSSAEDSHGYLEIRLKSPFVLNVTVTVTPDIFSPTNKSVYSMPLVPDRTQILTNLPAKFHSPATVHINTGPFNKFGLDYATFKFDRYNTMKKETVPIYLVLPFTGLKISVLCDRNWHGPYCDKFCNQDHADIINRRCTHNGTLGCPKDFHGPNCDIPLDQSSDQCQCENGGYCVSEFQNPGDTVDRLICECGVGFEGDHCETKGWDYELNMKTKRHGSPGKEALLEQFEHNSAVVNELLPQFDPRFIKN
ncbi:unnamed protein product [Caenorhabditis nigoni]